MEEPEEGFAKIEECTNGISMDKFLSGFKLDKVNKIVIKYQLDEDTTKTKTLETITNREEIRSFVSAIENVKCMEDFCLCDGDIEAWVYANNNLQLKVTLYIDEKDTIVKFYKPRQIPAIGDKLGGGNDFLIVDEKFCSWIYALVLKHLPEYID